jgi:hypothetical protein
VNVADVDGDGIDDLFCAQNFFGTATDITREDAGQGLWLKGRGDGTFEAIDASVSGIRVLGEQRGAALVDARAAGVGAPGLLENCNDDTPFRPTRAPDGSVDCPYNLVRTSIDGAPNFRSVMWNVVQTLPWLPLSAPGCFAYADMLTFGVPAAGAESPSFYANCGGKRLSDAEARAQFAAFSLLSMSSTQASIIGCLPTIPTGLPSIRLKPHTMLFAQWGKYSKNSPSSTTSLMTFFMS